MSIDPALFRYDSSDRIEALPHVRLDSTSFSTDLQAMLRFHRILFLPFLILLLSTLTLKSQVPGDGPRYPGTTGDVQPVDTIGLREVQERTENTAGLFEGPVDEEKYLVGPNDLVTIAIFSGSPKQFDVKVTAEGRIVVPGVAAVDVRGKSLASAKRSVTEAISRVYRAESSLTLKQMRQFKVTVIGPVKRPGTIAATPVTRVSEAIDLAGGATSMASKRNIKISRKGRTIAVDLMPFYSVIDRDIDDSNPFVQDGDRIQVGFQDPRKVVSIFGAAQRPGEYGFVTGDSISSLIRYAYGFAADAYLDSIEYVRVDDRGQIIVRETVRALPDGTVIGDRALEPGDRIFIRSYPRYRQTSRVVVAGEVRYPGSYPIEPGVTKVRDLLLESGGLTPDASLADAVLVRRQIQMERDLQMERIIQIEPEDRIPYEVEYYRNKSSERPGVMSINFTQLMAGDEEENLILRDDDSLYVPMQRGSLKVSGRVKNPGNLTWRSGMTYEQYIDLAGGYSWRADDDETQIIKGNTGERFLASSDDNYSLEPGDTIFVPEEPETHFWTDVAIPAITVIAQVATIIAVVVSLRTSTAGN